MNIKWVKAFFPGFWNVHGAQSDKKHSINKLRQSSVYMDNTGNLLPGSLHICRQCHTVAHTHSNKQAD